jgi:DNA polymerase/3'-5' exonuclease PolX
VELTEARQIAERIVVGISPHCEQVQIGGSIRRLKPNVKDIEIVLISSDRVGLIDALKPHGRFIKPGTPEIIDWEPRTDAKYLRMLLPDEIKCDIFLGTPQNWGGLFAMRTGSGIGPGGIPGFAAGLFAAWKSHSGGGRMTDCMPTTTAGVQIEVRTEEEFFQTCGVKWIEPSKRESIRSVKRLK